MYVEKFSLLFSQRLVEVSRNFLLQDLPDTSRHLSRGGSDTQGDSSHPNFQNTQPGVQVVETCLPNALI